MGKIIHNISLSNDGNLYLCMPRAENIPAPKDGWELTQCPLCGDDCYLIPVGKKILKDNEHVKAYCTRCSLKAGVSQ